MRLIAFGGDERMRGALAAARQAGWETRHITRAEDEGEAEADAVMLPWPHSFRGGRLEGGSMSREETLERVPPARAVLAGSGVSAQELAQCALFVSPQADEAFLQRNAALTAEGAVFSAMQRMDRPLADCTCVITGYGRIARALAKRLCAMGTFVIVCARSEGQMRAAHDDGAHPVPLAQAASACRQADLVMNTVPAPVLGRDALERLAGRAKVFELASAPYGMDMQLAARLGVEIVMEGGLPGRYAPQQAGAALFDALLRAMQAEGAEQTGGEEHG
ncbi:MAG: NAD(P)-binding domain-containing protein [Clostridia bacterium]|nr:NAD(P)-binding domain-containing protein [Clostridia bacterium]